MIRKSILKNNWDAKIVNIIHDEILVECHKDITKKVANAISQNMTKAFHIYAPDINMEITHKISKHWVH